MNFSKLTAYLDEIKKEYGIPGLEIQITKDHEIIYRHMTGHSDYARKVPASEQDLYTVYSCTKVMTMVAAMQLIEQGKLSLDDPLEKYIPEFSQLNLAKDYVMGDPPHKWPEADAALVPATKKIYIHQLMSMTAGLSYDTPAAAKLADPKDGTVGVVRAMAKMPLLFEPGDRYMYSLCHDVMAAVVEIVSGMRFGDYLKKYIFDPLGAEDMYFHVPEDKKHRMVAQNTYKTGTVQPSDGRIQITEDYESGGGGLICNVRSYSKVLDALACGGVGANGARILTEESLRIMSKDRLTDAQMNDFRKMEKVGYGYGLGVRTLIDGTASKGPVGEFGWDGAAGAYCVIDPVNHIGIFFAQQVTDMPPAGKYHPIIRDLVYEALEL